MIIHLHKNFLKGYKKLKESQKKKFKERRDLFILDEYNPILNNHALSGRYTGYRSINITGDIRAIYKKVGELSIFAAIDKHSNLYG